MKTPDPPKSAGDFWVRGHKGRQPFSSPEGQVIGSEKQQLNTSFILAELMGELGFSSVGWGVDILMNAFTHAAGIGRVTAFSTVDYWYRGIPRSSVNTPDFYSEKDTSK